ncbi:hypothetical protein [Glacieibacterium sp.]|uniref:hypothetical protein n=1 Tax=Glacieibacterium sp. TaxID=2860237 RepID=UPI003AFFAACA
MKKLLATAALLLATSGASAALMGQAPAPTLVRGTVASLSGQTLMVNGKNGRKYSVKLASDTRVAGVSVIGIDAIQPNSFIGTAAEPGPNGTLRATEVHVFPESMRGAGEGHRAWDLSKTSSMTNGNVATVGKGKAGKGRTLVVDYKGGQQTVVVPANVPIVAFAPATMALVKPGAHVFAITTPDVGGALAAASLAVGINGTVPPM